MQDPNQTDCKDIAEMLGAFRDMELTADESHMVEAHLVGCPPCKAELAAIEVVVAKLQSLPELPVLDFADAIEARILAGAAAANSQANQSMSEPGMPSKVVDLQRKAADIQNSEPGQIEKPDQIPALAVVADNVRPFAPVARRFSVRALVAVAAIVLFGLVAAATMVPRPAAQVAESAAVSADSQLASKKIELDKTGVAVSDDIVALYDEEGANNASDAGISTNEDGLYAIKM